MLPAARVDQFRVLIGCRHSLIGAAHQIRAQLLPPRSAEYRTAPSCRWSYPRCFTVGQATPHTLQRAQIHINILDATVRHRAHPDGTRYRGEPSGDSTPA